MATCASDGNGWGACTGEVTPQPKTCATLADVACDGLPCVDWAEGFGPNTTGGQEVGAVALDPTDGSMVMVGDFAGTITFGSQTFTQASTANNSLYVVRLAPDGSVVWAVPFDGGGYGCAVTVDGNGNVYVGGRADSPPTIGSNALPAGDLVMKLDKNGNLQWAETIGDPPSGGMHVAFCTPMTMAMAPDGDLLVAGYSYHPLTLGDAGTAATSGAYVSKLSSSTGAGALTATGTQWTQVIANANAPRIGIDGNGLVYVVTTLTASTTFCGAFVSVSNGQALGICSYDKTGAPQWGQGYGTATSLNVDAIAVSSFGNVVVAGQVDGTLSLLGSSLTSTSTAGDGYVVQINNWGASPSYGWGKTFGTNGAALGVGLDTNANVRMLGWFTGTTTLGSPSLSAGSNQMMLLAELSGTDGTAVWTEGWVYPGTTASYLRFAAAPAGDAFVGGALTAGPFNLGTGPLIQPTDQSVAWAGRFAP
jgi:hypothetical protein